MKKSIPNETIGRLFPYFRALQCLSKEGHDTVSSFRLAKVCHINASIIRKDLSYFGELGTKGVGYNVKKLIGHMRDILGLDSVKNAALVGVGNIGKALLSYPHFESEGIKIMMAFDNQPKKIGRKIKHIIIEDVTNLETRIKSENVQLGILSVPESEAPLIARRMVRAGIKAILSFAPCQLTMPDNIKISCVDLSTELVRLIYYSSTKHV
jgi:redox-sensing transcriptional repressor